MNVLIVDDEPLARQRLVRLLEPLGDYHVVAEAQNGEQAIACYEQHLPDVVLMDIRMPVMDGLTAARHMAHNDKPPALIFCTAYDDYALDAFDSNAVDYLLKPVNRDKLAQALDKAQKLNRVQLSALDKVADNLNKTPASDDPQPASRSHICARSSRGMELVPLSDVRYFLADQKYVTVYHIKNNQLCETLIDDSLKELEQEFSGQLLRVHRNALVAIAHIQGLERCEDAIRVKLADMHNGPQVSRRHMASVRKLLQHL